MLELLLAIIIVAGLLAMSFLPELFSTPWIIQTSLSLMALGLGAGLPIAAYYHFKLFSFLKKHSIAPKRWWLDPRPLHRGLPPLERNQLSRLFFIGASCFAACIAGALVLILLFIWESPGS